MKGLVSVNTVTEMMKGAAESYGFKVLDSSDNILVIRKEKTIRIEVETIYKEYRKNDAYTLQMLYDAFVTFLESNGGYANAVDGKIDEKAMENLMVQFCEDVTGKRPEIIDANGGKVRLFKYVSESDKVNRFDLENFYEGYMEMNCSLEQFLEAIASMFETGLPGIKPYSIGICPVEDLCEHIVHRQVEDLALVPLANDGAAFFDYSADDDPEVVVDKALGAAKENFGYYIGNMGKILADKLGGFDLLRKMIPKDMLPAFEDIEKSGYLTVGSGYEFGAAALFFDGVMDEIWDKVNGDYFIIPVSKQDWIIAKDEPGVDPESILLDNMKAASDAKCSKDDILTVSIYKYSRKNGFKRI